MNQHAVVSKFSHVKPGDTEFKGGGLRDFFLYRDLGIADAGCDEDEIGSLRQHEADTCGQEDQAHREEPLVAHVCPGRSAPVRGREKVAGQEGFEPPTRRFGVCRSAVRATGLHYYFAYLVSL